MVNITLFKRLILIIIICLSSITVQAYTIKLSIEGGYNNIVKIEKDKNFQISYSLSTDAIEELKLLDNIDTPKKVKGCEIIDFRKIGTYTQTTYLNGSAKNIYSVAYTLTLKPIKKGKFSFGPVRIGDIESNKIEFEILPSSKDKKLSKNAQIRDIESIELGTGNDDLFLKVELPNDKIYQHIPFYYVIKLYTKYDGIRNFDFLEMPEFKSCKFTDTYDVSSRYMIEEHNGQKYATCIAEKFEVTPLKSGKLKINKGKYDIYIDMPMYYDDPFWGRIATTQTQRYTIDIPEISFFVESLDKEIPTEFDGIIGEFNISSKISKYNPKINETIILSYIIAGETKGVENLIEKKILNLSSDNFEIRVNKNIENLPEGFKKCEYYITPRIDSVLTIPIISVTYFNPETKNFETVKTKEFNIVVGGHKN